MVTAKVPICHAPAAFASWHKDTHFHGNIKATETQCSCFLAYFKGRKNTYSTIFVYLPAKKIYYV
jgi:hypothetical protein